MGQEVLQDPQALASVAGLYGLPGKGQSKVTEHMDRDVDVVGGSVGRTGESST
jgi:hypothetical protein